MSATEGRLSPIEDGTDNCLQDENRQDDLDQDGRPTITPLSQHLRFLDDPNSYEESREDRNQANQANIERTIRSQIQELATQIRREIQQSFNAGEQTASGVQQVNYVSNTAGSCPTTANLQESAGTSMPSTPTAVLDAHRPVDAGSVLMTNYKKATNISILLSDRAKLSLDNMNPMPKIKLKNDANEAIGLYTLVTGERTPPVVTLENPNGYKSKSVKMANKHGESILVVTPEDDYYCYAAEKESAFHLIMLMIDKNLYHFIKDLISEKDPKRIYNELLSHFAGHKQLHIEHAKVTLESHNINANEITLSISVFREKLLTFEDAQESDTTEQYRVALLKK